MAEALVLVEHAEGTLKKITTELITAARVLGEPSAVVVGAPGTAAKLTDALKAAGASPEQVVRTRMYVTDITSQAEIGRAHQEMLGHVRPVATMVEVAQLADPAHLVEVELEAYVGR